MADQAKLFSLSDINGKGEAKLSIVRADNEKFSVILDEGERTYWEARLAAIRLKKEAETKDAELAPRQSG
jgi:hypothetical protein